MDFDRVEELYEYVKTSLKETLENENIRNEEEKRNQKRNQKKKVTKKEKRNKIYERGKGPWTR